MLKQSGMGGLSDATRFFRMLFAIICMQVHGVLQDASGDYEIRGQVPVGASWHYE